MACGRRGTQPDRRTCRYLVGSKASTPASVVLQVPLNVLCMMDESRDAGPPAFSAVAGLCAFKGRWLEFEPVGRSILARHGYDALHATDMFRGKRYRKGAFKGAQDSALKALMQELFEAAGQHDVSAFARAMFEDTHDSQKAVLDKSHNQSPYGACYSLLVDSVLQTCVEHDLRLWIEWEEQREIEPEIRSSFAAVRDQHALHGTMMDLVFVPKNTSVGLMLADIVAYIARRGTQRMCGSEQDWTPLMDDCLEIIKANLLFDYFGATMPEA